MSQKANNASMRFVLLLLALAALPLCAAPNIIQCSPYGLLPGKKTVLSFSGSGLEKVSNLWTSAECSVRLVSNTNSDLPRFEVTCPAEKRGIQALQLAGPQGASNYRLILIDSLPAQSAPNDHHSRSNAYRITPPVGVDCALKPEQVDYYVFSARAGETLSLEVIAHRIGSEMDPVARIYDMTGRELVSCDDEPGIWRDARFVFRAPSAGEYVLGVHDAAFGGGTSYFYRLRVSHDPLIWYTYPLPDPSEPTVPFESIGTVAANEFTRSPANPPEAAGLTILPSTGEIEPNNAATQAQHLFLPGILNGKINLPGDTAYFRFSAGKDQKLIFQSATRSLGSPCDLVLTIKSSEGKILAQSDSSLPGDAAVTNRFAESGEYLLEVHELSGNSPANVPYRVKVSEFQSGINASVDENRLQSVPGGTVNLKVTCTRYDYSGPIYFAIEPPIAGLSLEEAVPGKKNDLELKIKISAEVPAGFFTHFKLKATPESGLPASFVSTGPALRNAFPLMLNPPPVLDGLFSLALKPE